MSRGSERRRRCPWLAVWSAVAALAAAGGGTSVRADIFHLADGGRIEGEQTETADGMVRIRTRHATILLPAARIERVEKSPLSWKLYETLRDKHPDTPQGRHELGLWCRRHGLDDLAAVEFARALELDPNHAATRQALGHVRVGDAWLEVAPDGAVLAATEGANRPAAGPADPPPDAESARIALLEAEQEMSRALRAEWFKRIRGIRATYLTSSSRTRFAEGAELLLAIRDPLAVEPMIHVLGDGTVEHRKLLATALGQFASSAAMLALLETSILDEDAEVRRAALLSLSRQSDPRIAGFLVRSLSSDEEAVIRNSADAIGYLRLVEAMPALIEALTTEKEIRRVRTETVVRTLRRDFIDETGQLRTGTLTRRRSNPFYPEYEKVTVTVFRTEVQEALIAITGENYGFDANAWTEWYRRHGPQPPAAAPVPVPAGNRPPPAPPDAPAGN